MLTLLEEKKYMRNVVCVIILTERNKNIEIFALK